MILEHIRSPEDLKKVPEDRLDEVAVEIRRKILETVTRTGGHLGSGMGVVELTIALHYVYNFGHDRLFLDTGHQCYPHKLLTGRYDRFETLRTYRGISGFPNIDECPQYDMMTSGHAGTAISMGLGACVGDALAGNDRKTVVVVGDASVVSGMSFEALNNAGHLDQDLLVILNANEQSIGRTTGAFARMLSRVRMSKLYLNAKDRVAKFEKLLSSIPVIGERMDKGVHELVNHVKHAFVPGHLFEELGFSYYGIYDGHDLGELLPVLRQIKNRPGIKLLHVQTVKGAGVEGCEEDPLALHGAKPGDSYRLIGEEAATACAIDKLEPKSGSAVTKKKYDFAKCFAEQVMVEGENHPELVTITAGMPDGTGLVPFRDKWPDRFHNVGIAEQHGVGFAGGLCVGGARPVVVLYSTFMQRGYDQVFQEVALQRHPVVMMLSHGGFAGEDGATHHGLFDIPILRCLPGITLMAPRDGAELQEMFRFALEELKGPVAIRYPKASTPAPEREVAPIVLGEAEVLREGEDVALVGYGPMSETALEAADALKADGHDCTVVNARFARPLDTALLQRLNREHRLVVTIEEGCLNGGFGSAVLEEAARDDQGTAKVYPIGVGDEFCEHGARANLLEMVGLTPGAIRATVLERIEALDRIRTIR